MLTVRIQFGTINALPEHIKVFFSDCIVYHHKPLFTNADANLTLNKIIFVIVEAMVTYSM